MSFFKGLLRNGLIEEAHGLYRLMTSGDVDVTQASALTTALSDAYQMTNRPFVAEQILRSFAARYPDQADGYLLLARFHLAREDSLKAALWLELPFETSTLHPLGLFTSS